MPHLANYARYPIEILTGMGCRLQDTQGRWYLDATAGIAVMALGHGHPVVKAAVHAQVDQLMHVSNLYHVPIQTRLFQALSAAYGGAGILLQNSGTEATEAAVKLARKYHWRRGDPRAEIIVLDHAFHGRTMMALAMTPKPAYQEGYAPLPGLVKVVAPEAAAAAVSEATAAIFVEPVQGEGGCRPIGGLAEIRAACDRTGALLVYDEIQCGLGRTGVFTHDPAPDIVTLAKALGGGLPLGAVVARTPEVGAAFQPGDHGTTFGGNPVSCAAGLATLEIILGEDLPSACATKGQLLAAGLAATGAEVTGRGLLLAAHLGRPGGPVVDAMREKGVLVCTAGPEAVRFVPPYLVSEDEIAELIEVFAASL